MVSKLISGIHKLAKIILAFCRLVERLGRNWPEFIALALYVIGHLVMAIFHEPWYDEAVAWQIARCASVKDILFEIPHYEGHPPLWHLVLLPFAKLGAPYELSLSFVSLLFTGTAVALILWKSPFPRLVRLLIPFTYFFFYQYSVISRPYSMMMLAFVLLAMAYPTRNEKPGRYTLGLMFLCLTSAYGIVLAGGLAMVWVWEIWNKQNILQWFKSFLHDRRILWLAGLLLLAILLILEIMPREDTGAYKNIVKGESENNWFIRLLYTTIFITSDGFFTNLYSSYDFLQNADLFSLDLPVALILGIISWLSFFFWGKKKKTLLVLILPHVLFSLFSASFYFCIHHTGIILLFYVFWLWISLGSNVCLLNYMPDISIPTHSAIVVGLCFSMCFGLFWSISSSLNDINYSYSVGRNIASFINEHKLYERSIMSQWGVEYDKDGIVLDTDTRYYIYSDNVSPYFKENIFYNVMHGSNTQNYTSHRVASQEENRENIAFWKEHGYPDILFMFPELGLLWDNTELSYDDYALIYYEDTSQMWKNGMSCGQSALLARRDLLEELGLPEIGIIVIDRSSKK